MKRQQNGWKREEAGFWKKNRNVQNSMNKYLWKTLSKDSSRGKNIKNIGRERFVMDI